MAAGAVWITGAGGFAGRWLLQLLRDRGRAAAALVRRQLADAPDLPWAQLDLETAALAAPGSPVARLEGLPEPCGLIHLAAWSHPAACEAEPGRALQVNVAGPARLYEQVLARWPRLPVLHVSSAYVYRPQAERLREEQAGEPENAYGASKLQGEAVALGLRDRGFRVRVARPFNHSGPGQAPRFALPSFALRIARLEAEGGGRSAPWTACGTSCT